MLPRFRFAALAAPTFGLLVLCAPLAATAGGNEALMREWAAKKRQAKERIFQGLQEQGLVPRNGTVSFEAVVKPDPDFPDKTRIVIESIRISPSPGTAAGDPLRVEGGAAAEAMAAAFKPVDMSQPTIFQSLDVPVGAALTDELTVENGRLRKEDLAPPDPATRRPVVEPQAAPAPEAELGWWDKILNFFRF